MPSTPPKPRKPRTSFGTLGAKGAKYYPSYVGPDKHRYRSPSPFTTRSQARSWLNAQQAAIEAGEWAPATAKEIAGKFVPTRGQAVEFVEFARKQIASRRKKDGTSLAQTTLNAYALDLRNLHDFHGRDLRFISREEVDVWWDRLLDAEEPKLTTASHAYTLLRAVMQEAIEQKLIATNPAHIPGAGSLRTGKKVRKPSDREVEKVLAVLSPQWLALFTCEAWGMLRYGEAIELRPKDVQIEHRILDDGETLVPEVTLHITRGVTWKKGVGAVVGPPKSNAGVRSVVLAEAPSAVIAAYLESEHAPKSANALIWGALSGTGHLRYSVYWRMWANATEAAGVDYFNPHALRHYGATLLAQAGATTKELQVIIGHSTPTMAMKYQHAGDPTRMSDLANRAQALATENAARANRIEELKAKQAKLAAELKAQQHAAAAELAALEAELTRA